MGSFPRFYEDKGCEISVNPVRKYSIFSNSALSDGASFLTG